MNRSPRLFWRNAGLSLLILITVGRAQTMPATVRQDLIGVWQLERIEIIGPKGQSKDPFYNNGSTGVLIYDASGWMSVQIASNPRPALDAPAVRPVHPLTDDRARLAASVLDTYYAYAGTWEFDSATSIVTHHINSSLLSAEVGRSYPQQARVNSNTLTFTTRRADLGSGMVQEKVWKRVVISAE